MANFTVYFATNRMPLLAADDPEKIVSFGSEPGPIDGTAIRFGQVQVQVGPKNKVQILPDSLIVAPERLYGASPIRGSRTIFDQLREDMKNGGRPTLALLHGFSNTFEDAMERAATIGNFYGIDANLFSFTWPSRSTKVGVPLPYADYIHDRETARASGMAIARTIRILYDYIDRLSVSQVCRQPIHLIVHSMGNYALRHAVQALMQLPLAEPREYALAVDSPEMDMPAERFPALVALPTEERDPNRLRRTFDQIILAAPDEDEDAFEDNRELKELPRLGNRVTVYHSNKDWILSTLSRYTKFNGPRLGNSGPDNMSMISDKVSAVDVSAVIDDEPDVQNHQYYRLIPTVRDDIKAVLSGRPQEDIPRRSGTGFKRYTLKPTKGSRL